MRSVFANRWWIVFGSVIGLMVGNVTILQFSASVLMKPIMAELGWNRSLVSAAVMLGSLCAAIGTPIAGRLMDRRGVKRVTLTAITLFALAIAAMSMAPANPYAFLAMFSLVGLFSAGQAPLPYAKAVAAAFDHRRGLAMGVAMTGVGLGAALVPRLTQLYLDTFGWRGAYVAVGLTVFVVAFSAVALFIRDGSDVRRSAQTASCDGGLPGMDARMALRDRHFWQLAITFFCIPLVANGVIVHLVPLLTDRGIPANRAVELFAGVGASLIVGRLLCGYLLDRFFGPYVAIGFVALPAIGVLTLFFSSDPMLTALGAVFVGLGLGAEVDLIAYLQSRYFGLRAFGQIYGYLFAIFTIGSGLGPFMMGAAFDALGSYRPALATFVLVLACAAWFLGRLPRQYPYPATGQGGEQRRPAPSPASVA
ncbi:MFS transporter [Cupriavidus agavae]|uniref:Putative MFS family arabinose efflux permease n=1 Tax=Cupriavidus agavae TaxID=1001822 RepID=A0A4Q7S1J4_9BURK|nr:MFS transporter [Cupriavidus agavae]RZT39210.1 putative MFS family arabinose efflux permease [Cupriavidus agavae]